VQSHIRPRRLHIISISGIERTLAVESRRLWLWLPVLVGLGISVYFSLSFEPFFPLTLFVFVALLALCWVVQRRGRGHSLAFLACAALSIAMSGFVAAQLRTIAVAAPRLDRSLGPVSVAGEVVNVEAMPRGGRLTIARPAISGLTPRQTPERVRVRYQGRSALPDGGEHIRFTALLQPPAEPGAPGAFDFQRHAYFQQIGAVGTVLGDIERMPRPRDGALPSLSALVLTLRLNAADTIHRTLDSRSGPIVAALLIGQTTRIPQDVFQAVRDSGLAHLLSISGLHIGMAFAFFYLSLRKGLALLPYVALRVDIKKMSAAIALLGCFFYMLLAGAPIPTIRSFIMIAVVTLAIFLDRQPVSIFTLAWAALFILLLWPEALLGPSFQMSFAAMVALVAFHEQATYRSPWLKDKGILLKPAIYVWGIVITTVLANIATAPYVVYHFNRLPIFGVVANMLAIPLTGFWIMPWGVLALLAMPFGLAAVPLRAMDAGASLIVSIAEQIASWPGAVLALATPPLWAVASFALGGLWLCLWQRRWRLAGIPLLLAGLVGVTQGVPADIFIDAQGRLMAVRLSSGALAFSKPPLKRREEGLWQQRSSAGAGGLVWPKHGTLDGGRLACDPLGCTLRGRAQTVALSRSVWSLRDDCRFADAVVSFQGVDDQCARQRHVIDEWTIQDRGAHTITLSDTALDIESTGRHVRHRPWNSSAPAR
jgi:competence protein ComEC